ncbi:MAG: response regulator [Candidatus Zixiibacteriota bacterium]
MSGSAQLIRKYFQASFGRGLDQVIGQVDLIAQLAGRLLACDFIAILYRKDGNDSPIPVAFWWDKEAEVGGLKLFEDRWFRQRTSVTREFRRHGLDSDPGVARGISDDNFAVHNEFGWSYQFPFYDRDQLRGVVVGYWKACPPPDGTESDSALELIVRLITAVMDSTNDVLSADNYASRLSELIAMFDLPIGEDRFGAMVDEIVRRSRQVVPVSGCCLLKESEPGAGFELADLLDETPAAFGFADELAKVVTEETRSSPFVAAGRCQYCLDLSDRFPPSMTGVIALPIVPDSTLQLVLVVWTRSESGFSSNDKELLSVFGLFARTILRNAMLVMSLKVSNRRLKTSSLQVANMETLAALADMTSGVAHEFNNIIGGIVGRIQLMQLKCEDEAVLSELGKVQSLALEGAETIRRIQEFTSSVRYKKLEKVDLGEIVSNSLKNSSFSFKELSDKKGLSIIVDTSCESAKIDGCEADMIGALGRLLINAVEHAPEGSTVTIRLREDESKYHLSVHDSGEGIPDEIRGKLFYPFFTTKQTRGSGLGLSVVHGIAIRHGAEVSCHSNPDEGTSFTLDIPKSSSDDEISEITRRDKKRTRLRVLVVDDDVQIREVLADMLTLDGHEPKVCADAYSALEAFDVGNYDLLITDLGMPGMSGLELAGRVHKKSPDTPIAMVTGWGTQLDHKDATLRGVQTVLSKPFHFQEIKDMVQDLTARD